VLFVTGGTGYLGSTLIQLLVERGYDVRAAVRNPERASVLPDGVEQAPADLSDEDALARAMAGCDGVFHLAASLGQRPEDTRELNVEGTRRVLRAARRAGVSRVVHTSSSAAIIDASGLVSEDAPNATALVDIYSTTKAEAEGVCFEAVAGGQDVRIVNVVNAYGPSPRGPSSYNALFLAFLRGQVGTVIDAPVGWILAEDVAIGHVLAFEKGEPGKRYVVCGEVAPFSTVLDGIARHTGSSQRVRALPPGSDLPPDAGLFARRSEVYGRLRPVHVADANARGLGLTPRGLDEGLSLTAGWFRELCVLP
jgi:dihydroflavonol-4-reductase